MSERIREVVRRSGMVCVVAALLVGPWLYVRAPRHSKGGTPAFVRFGPNENPVHLPLRDFACDDADGVRRCRATLQHGELSLLWRRAQNPAFTCSARFAGRDVRCFGSSVSRGYPELSLSIDDPLGTSARERLLMRARDPLSHVTEGDWGVPMMLVSLGASLLAVSRFRAQRAAQLALGVALWASTGVATFVLCSVALLWLGYID